MFKKLFSFLFCLALLFTVACSGNGQNADNSAESIPSEPPTPEFVVNPLTGIEDLKYEKRDCRPFAVTINNISVAQPVQTGIKDADIVYETEVEGGITRLVAIYKDIESVEKIGTVRSARYALIDLAAGHNAVYIHHGQDPYHATPHFNVVDHFAVSEKYGGMRDYSNGLAQEHTLYAYGDKTKGCVSSNGVELTTDNNEPWVTFADKDTFVTYPTPAASITIPFSRSYKTNFIYDVTTGTYIRHFNGTLRKDYVTGESLQFKNVFVLLTNIKDYPKDPDGKTRRNVDLSSGDGFYCVNGTYTAIKWSKGAASNGFTFTNVDGTPLEVNVGNSWVCIADKSESQPIFE